MTTSSVALRLQRLDLQTQALVLAQISSQRAASRIVKPTEIQQLFHQFALPAPGKIANVVAVLATKKLLAAGAGRGEYRVSPEGSRVIQDHFKDLDLVALQAELDVSAAPQLGSASHALVPPTLAPPALIEPLRRFLADHPFETNIFAMTRYPDQKLGSKDPVGRALSVAREVCVEHGFELHLASDRAIADDLWQNVTAHMWASRFGIALFEDRADRGINHNLLIEVGAMVVTGRRCALLKDGSIAKLPTDLVGLIYKSIDLADEASIHSTVRTWLIEDLRVVAN